MRVALRVVVLPRPKRPEKRHKANPAQKQRRRNEDGQDFHGYFNRRALSETVIEESDIASAAARGVAAPTSASGTATTL